MSRPCRGRGRGLRVGAPSVTIPSPGRPPASRSSKVVQIRGLSHHVTEADLLRVCTQFGFVAYVSLTEIGTALLEFEVVRSAEECVTYNSNSEILVLQNPAKFSFSQMDEIPRKDVESAAASNVLVFYVTNAQQPITLDIMWGVVSPIARPIRIGIKGQEQQVWIEFANADTARNVKRRLNGCDVYPGCCTLKIEFAKFTCLIVPCNDKYQRNYVGSAGNSSEPRSGWVCVTVGNMNFGHRENEFCTRLAEEAGNQGFEIGQPLATRSAYSIHHAKNIIQMMLANQYAKNALACLVISCGTSDLRTYNKELLAAHEDYRYYTASSRRVQECLNDSWELSRTAEEFCRICKFTKSDTKPAFPPQANVNGKRWIAIIISERLHCLDNLKEFCDHLCAVTRARSFNLGDCVMLKQVRNINEAVNCIKSLPNNPQTQNIGACLIIVPFSKEQGRGASLNEMVEDFNRAIGRKPDTCIFGESELVRSLVDAQAMAGLADKFAEFCDIPNSSSVAMTSDMPAATYPINELRLRDLYDKVASGALATSSSDLIQELTVDRSFSLRIKRSTEPNPKKELLVQIMKLLAAAGEYNLIQLRENVTDLLYQLITAPGFLQKATDLMEHGFDRTQEQFQAFVKDLLFVLWLLLDRFPSNYCAVRTIVDKTKHCILNLRTHNPEIDELLERIEKCLSFIRHRALDENRKPPKDFRQISICPSKEDFGGRKTFLNKNRTEGAYENSEQYLDVLFRLLREDFIGPLREGILDYSAGDHQTGRTGLYVYKQAKIRPTIIDRRSGTKINPLYFNPTLSESGSLKFGSLVCLFADNFQNILFATVADSSEELLRRGEVSLNFEFQDQPGRSQISYTAEYTMVEPHLYFPDYRHVLRGLQAIPKNEPVPFERYLVFCNTDVGRPAYLNKHPSVEFDSLTGKQTVVQDVFNDEYWPSKEELDLDESQLEALKQALISELAIIQGPSGTARTFIGLQLVKLLLSNEELWNPEHKHPILVVCHENQVLDQFLEGIIPMVDCDDLIRVGDRCKAEKLQSCCLHIVRCRKRNLVPGPLRFEIRRSRGKIIASRDQIHKNTDILQKLNEGQLKLKLLKDLEEYEQQYGKLSKNMHNLMTMSDSKVLQSAKVIGMTTSDAAQNQALMRSIQPRIVIMEDAAEVLESHLVTSLTAGCQHVILIGDHQQPRPPSSSVYELAKHRPILRTQTHSPTGFESPVAPPMVLLFNVPSSMEQYTGQHMAKAPITSMLRSGTQEASANAIKVVLPNQKVAEQIPDLTGPEFRDAVRAARADHGGFEQFNGNLDMICPLVVQEARRRKYHQAAMAAGAPVSQVFVPLTTEWVPSVDGHAKCCICQEILDVHTCKGCMAMYHHNCIKNWLSGSPTCPTCRRNLQMDEKLMESQ